MLSAAMEENMTLARDNEAKALEIAELSLFVEKLNEEVDGLREGYIEKETLLRKRVAELEDLRNKLEKLESLNESLEVELKEKTDRNVELITSLNDTENQLQEKIAALEEAHKKIEKQQMNIGLLKEACIVLDKQLKDFETSYTKKFADLENTESIKQALEMSVVALKQDVQNLKIEVMESKGVSALYKSKWESVANEKLAYDKACEELESYRKRLQDVNSKNMDLTTRLQRYETKADDALEDKNTMRKLLEACEAEVDTTANELGKVTKKNGELAKENAVLAKALAESIEKAEVFKSRCEELESQQQQHLADHEIVEQMVKLKSTIRQYAKLIEYMQQQNELLAKKKERRFPPIFGKSREENVQQKESTSQKENVPPKENVPSQKGSASPKSVASADVPEDEPPTVLTQGNLIKEAFDVERLEKTVMGMRAQLAKLQEEATQNCQTTTPSLSPVKKENCVLLKDDKLNDPATEEQ